MNKKNNKTVEKLMVEYNVFFLKQSQLHLFFGPCQYWA